MDPLLLSMSLYRRRKFTECINICTDILHKNENDLAAWLLKMQCLTSQVYVDEIEMESEDVNFLVDESALTSVPRPGTSLKKANLKLGTSQGLRPLTNSGRPLTGFIRPRTQLGKTSTLEQAVTTPRNLHTARPVSSMAGRFIRLGTASMLGSAEGNFIILSRLDLGKYAAKSNLAKSLFEYIFHHENDVKNALEYACLAIKVSFPEDHWWWKIQLGKCYHRLGLYRDAERQFQSSLKDQPVVDTYLFLGKVYEKIDQPLSAIQTFNIGLEIFLNDLHLLLGVARIQEGLGNTQNSLATYKMVLQQDNMCIEAIACIAMNHFYADQPEISLKFYRRLLQMGVYNSEIFNNVGLCCYFAQQYDLVLASFNRALSFSDDKTSADIWYNLGHISLGIGDLNLAYQCFHLALAECSDHAESYNNLGVIEFRRNQNEKARAFLQASFNLSEHQFEPHFNYALLADKMGDLQASYNAVKKSLNVFMDHYDSRLLYNTLQEHFLLI